VTASGQPVHVTHFCSPGLALAGGSFQPSPVVRVEIAKHGGGVRRLAVPALSDRIEERGLLAELDLVIDPLCCRGALPTGTGSECATR
jgi:hypothetical protein